MSSCGSCGGPSCAPKSEAQKELQSKLQKLREEQQQLDIKLNGDSCEINPVEDQLDAEKARLAQVTNKAACLLATKAKIEAKIVALRDRSAERTKAIDTLSQYVETEKTKLKEEVDKVTKEFQAEAQGRISVEAKIEDAYEEQENAMCPYIPAGSQANMAAQLPAVPQSPMMNAGQPYAYPYDASLEKPARYLREHMRNNPVRPIPFPNDAMDEAEAYGQCAYNPDY